MGVWLAVIAFAYIKGVYFSAYMSFMGTAFSMRKPYGGINVEASFDGLLSNNATGLEKMHFLFLRARDELGRIVKRELYLWLKFRRCEICGLNYIIQRFIGVHCKDHEGATRIIPWQLIMLGN